MCSVAEGDFGDEGGIHTMIKDIVLNTKEDENCKKCSVEKCVIKLDFKEAMCLSCFLYYVRHKFRATLGSSKILKRQSNVLFDFKGHPQDVCLLHMINFAFEEETYKRLSFNLKLVFVDEYCTSKATADDMEKRMEKILEIRDILNQFPNFTCCYSTIADSSKIVDDIKTISLKDIEAIAKSEEEFLSTYNSIEALTSKQDFLEVMRKNVTRDIANYFKCSYIFLSDISVDLAKKLLSNIALGRGSSVANDVSFCDDRIDGIKIIKPLKDLYQVEVDNYVKFSNLKSCLHPTYTDDNLLSIQNLTSNFINQLQQNSFNSTVSTVYKVCGKLAPKKMEILPNDNSINSKLARSYIKDINQRCLLCKSNLDYHHSETIYAIEFSSQLSSNTEGLVNLEKIREISENSKCGNENDHNKFLCHGCRNIVSGMKEDALTNIF